MLFKTAIPLLLFLATCSAVQLKLPIEKHHGRPSIEYQDKAGQAPLLAKANKAITTAGNLPINNEANIWYLTRIKIGTPPRSFRALLDINWRDLFVPSSNCSGYYHYCSYNRQYNSSQSSTYKPDLTPAYLNYVSDFTGNVSVDTVNIAGVDVPDQQFLEVTQIGPRYWIWYSLFDSVLGFSRWQFQSGNSTFKGASPFSNMLSRGLLDRNVFSLRLPRVDEDYGELTLGSDDDTSLDKKKRIDLPLTDRSYPNSFIFKDNLAGGWQTAIESIQLSTSEHHNMSAITISVSNHTAIFSTSLPVIALPHNVFNQIYPLINETDFNRCDPVAIAKLPTMTITFSDNKEWTIIPRDYIFIGPTIWGEPSCEWPFTSMRYLIGNGEDNGDSDDSHQLDGAVIVGTGVLRGSRQIFDLDRKTISFEELIE